MIMSYVTIYSSITQLLYIVLSIIIQVQTGPNLGGFLVSMHSSGSCDLYCSSVHLM